MSGTTVLPIAASVAPEARCRSRNLVLAAMILAVAMTFIDQTIVSVAAPTVQRELGLSSTGTQWAVNAYILTLAAFFAFGGRLADTVGHTKVLVIGIVVFATASALCGLTPAGHLAEGWIIAARAVQGMGAAIMFPAALAIVVQTFPLNHRGRALALFFGIAGALTSIGPIAGGYLTQWTWRAIFWVNVPVAILALLFIAIARPTSTYRPARMDFRGLVLIAGGIGLSVFGFQQASNWGWAAPATWLCIAAGVALLVVFYLVERGTTSPLIQFDIFRIRAFRAENFVLGIAMLVGIPVYFFASEYAQIALGKPPTNAALVLLYFFIGFVVAAQIGGRMLDRVGAKRPVVLGCVLAAAGFALWADKATDLSLSSQIWFIILAGAGLGLMQGQANTDAVNRASRLSYGEATGITQTVRNYAAALGLAVLGTILVSGLRSHLTSSFAAGGLTPEQAASTASRIAEHQGGGGSVATVPHFVRLDFAYASQTVFYVMAGIMGAAAVVAMLGLRYGRQEEPSDASTDETGRTSGQDAGQAPTELAGWHEPGYATAPLEVAGSERVLDNRTGPSLDGSSLNLNRGGEK
jgi:EmrB/QacA subfamily drug resistance transporter